MLSLNGYLSYHVNAVAVGPCVAIRGAYLASVELSVLTMIDPNVVSDIVVSVVAGADAWKFK